MVEGVSRLIPCIPWSWQVDGIVVSRPEGQGLRSDQGRREVVEGRRAKVGGDIAEVGVGAVGAAVGVAVGVAAVIALAAASNAAVGVERS